MKAGQINLEDAIDIRQINNLKLANQMLKLKRKQKAREDQAQKQKMIQAQAQANAESAEKAAMYEVQKRQAMAETELQIEQGKSQFKIQQMQNELQNELTQMEQKFKYDMQLKQMDLKEITTREQFIEDRKDQRTKLQATQQSAMIQQRQDGLLPTDFNSQPNGEPLAEQAASQVPQVPEDPMQPPMV